MTEREKCEQYARDALSQIGRDQRIPIHTVADIIEAARRDAVEGRWVSVADAMPKQKGCYIVYAPSPDENSPLITTSWWTLQGWGIVERWASRVTHWMPLPDAPAEGTVRG